MDVSVIILTRNTCALARAAIKSVLDSGDPLAKEILVVDNGSTDETASALPREFPQVKFIRSETNLGFARACNLAAKKSSGEFLLLLNSDARPVPDALEKPPRGCAQTPVAPSRAVNCSTPTARARIPSPIFQRSRPSF